MTQTNRSIIIRTYTKRFVFKISIINSYRYIIKNKLSLKNVHQLQEKCMFDSFLLIIS